MIERTIGQIDIVASLQSYAEEKQQELERRLEELLSECDSDNTEEDDTEEYEE